MESPPRLPAPPVLHERRPGGFGLFTKSAAGRIESASRDEPIRPAARSPPTLETTRTRDALKADESEIEAVASASGAGRVHKAAVVASLRDATRQLDPGMAVSVQSVALSLLQPDSKGTVSKEEVASVWLTNVLPALERAPARLGTDGPLVTQPLTDRLQKLLGGRLSR